jgi:micrococcal nuclease
MLTVGLILAGCDAPAHQAEQPQGNGGAGKQTQEEQAEEGPSAEVKPAVEQKKNRSSKKVSESKPKADPEPQPPANAASHGSSGHYDATVTVSRVVDGDTIEILPSIGGNEEVRLIGIDTPETKDPSEGVEPYGPEASAFATKVLTGSRVQLEFDVEREDQYNRLLAYVWLRPGGAIFNEVLLKKGYAQAYPYPPNTNYEARFAATQEQARAARLGLWGLSHAQQCKLADRGNGIGEGTPGCEDDSASSSASASPSASPSAYPSAAQGDGSGGGRARNRGGGAPASSGGDIDCDQVNGPIPTPPGDPNNLDGDGDGLACE